MECPHCGAECLMGATTCFACGQSLFGSGAPSLASAPPPWRPDLDPGTPDVDAGTTPQPDASAEPAAMPRPFVPSPPFSRASNDRAAANREPAQRRRRATLCKVCVGPCNDPLSQMCDTCRAREAMSGVSASPPAAFSQRLGTAAFRPPPVERAPTPAQKATKALVWGVLLVVAGLGVVRYARPEAAGARLVREARNEAVEVAFAMPDDPVMRYRTTMDVQILREETPSTFDTSLMRIFELRQVSSHDHEVVVVEDHGTSASIDVRTECRLENQTGVFEQKDGSRLDAYPWPGRVDVTRVTARRGDVVTTRDGDEPLPARDVPPFLTFGHTGGPTDALQPGERWSTEALLPCLATRVGALAPSLFACEFRYTGRRVLQGRECAVVQLEARPSGTLDERFDSLDEAGGRVSGALAFDADTGLLVSAELSIDTHARRGGSAPTERVGLKGALTVTRD